jgi:hypothetical protein
MRNARRAVLIASMALSGMVGQTVVVPSGRRQRSCSLSLRVVHPRARPPVRPAQSFRSDVLWLWPCPWPDRGIRSSWPLRVAEACTGETGGCQPRALRRLDP